MTGRVDLGEIFADALGTLTPAEEDRVKILEKENARLMEENRRLRDQKSRGKSTPRVPGQKRQSRLNLGDDHEVVEFSFSCTEGLNCDSDLEFEIVLSKTTPYPERARMVRVAALDRGWSVVGDERSYTQAACPLHR